MYNIYNSFSLDTSTNEQLSEKNIKNNIFYLKGLESNEDNYILNKNFLQINDSTIQNIDYFEANKNENINDNTSNQLSNNNTSAQFNVLSSLKTNEITNNKKKINRLISNKISARKSRKKKKEYIKNLEEELAKLKNNSNNLLNKKINNYSNIDNINNNNIDIDNKNKNFFNNIIMIEEKEKEIDKYGQKENSRSIKEYEAIQKILLKELLIRQIKNFIPLKFQIFGKKYIRLININEDDSISVVKTKMIENLNKIESYNKNVSKGKIKFLIKFYETYKKLLNYIDNFQQLYSENF